MQLNNVLEAIEGVRQQHCSSISKLNEATLGLWLYNTDPELETIAGSLSAEAARGGTDARDVSKAVDTIRALGQGVGLVPRELILRSRIKTLAGMIRFPPQENIGFEEVQEFKTGSNNRNAERTIQAYLSAYYTLGEHTFPTDGIKMDELLPTNNNNESDLIELGDIRTSFDTYWIRARAEQNGNCIHEPVPIRVPRLVVGVFKRPEKLTYYAVRLRAQAQLLFNPFGGQVNLTAYSAAQPFGSRIGPKYDGEEEANRYFTKNAKPPRRQDCGFNCRVPNLPVYREDDDGGSAARGWYRYDVQEHMTQRVVTQSGGGGQVIEQLGTGYQAAMAPNPWERGKYMIPTDVGENEEEDPNHQESGDPFRDLFDFKLLHAFWAPVVEPGRAGELEEEIGLFIDSLGGGNRAMNRALQTGLVAYTRRLQNGTGEGGEGMNIVRLTDPVRRIATTRDPLGNTSNTIQSISQGNTRIFMDSERDLRTSWAEVRNEDYVRRGRTGYSVKFISFEALQNSNDRLGATPSREPWFNFIPTDPETEADLSAIRH